MLIPCLPISPLHAYNLADVAGSFCKALSDIYIGDCLSLRSVAATTKLVQVVHAFGGLGSRVAGRPLMWGAEKRKNPKVPGSGHLLL